jgi:hypothetical protein
VLCCAVLCSTLADGFPARSMSNAPKPLDCYRREMHIFADHPN